MTPHVQQNVPSDLLRLFENVKKLVAAIPDNINLGMDRSGEPLPVSCHIVARAVAEVFPQCSVHDGTFNKTSAHSWLRVGAPGDSFILDVYPVAMLGGPVLMPYIFIWTSLYQERRLQVVHSRRFKRNNALYMSIARATAKRLQLI